MTRRVFCLFCLLLLVGGGFCYYWVAQYQVRQVDSFKAPLDDEVRQEVPPDFMLSGVHLRQGKNGEEEWLLDAEKAFYYQQGEKVTLQRPDITYHISQSEAPLLASGRRGEVRQNPQEMFLWDDVVLLYGNRTLNTETLAYQGAGRVMTMPKKVWVLSPGMEGVMHDVVWSLDENVLHSRGPVEMVLYLDGRLDLGHSGG